MIAAKAKEHQEREAEIAKRNQNPKAAGGVLLSKAKPPKDDKPTTQNATKYIILI